MLRARVKARVSHIYYRVKMEEREILGKVRCSQESPEVV